MLDAIRDTISARFRQSFGGYDSTAPNAKRKAGPTRTVREDVLLRTGKRDRLSANAQDIARNFSIAMWMVRRHLDYVSRFDFHSQCETAGVMDGGRLDADINRLMLIDSRRQQMDAGGRCSREKLFRLAELRRTVDGDVGFVKLANGRLQGIEADLIRNPPQADTSDTNGRSEWIDGVRVGEAGRALAYAIHRRGRGGIQYEMSRMVSASNFFHFGHFTRFASDQTRGVSPLTAALNPLRDVYEGFDYALAKMKVSQLFALAFYRSADESLADITAAEDSEGNETGYSIDFGHGPVQLDLEPGDRAEFLESKTPSTEMQQFCNVIVAVALKALDIPYSFYDESFTNFNGSRTAWNHYERSALDKRDDQLELRREYTVWKLTQFIQAGRLTLPRGVAIPDLAWEWVPRGMPYWDKTKEVQGDKAAIGAGLDNPERACKRVGNGSVYENIEATLRVMQYAERRGKETLGRPLYLDFTPSGDADRLIAALEEKGASDDDN